ncbi:MAG: Cys-tRNA(Pro) deacylase [Clostridia bacterium]|nr:Cys-tRNA(Pro) deacylase [Clostridia bacterium]
MAKEQKTNAMRILEQMGVAFTHTEYEADEFTDGAATADRLGLEHEQVFKTLVTVGADRNHYVFVIPVDESLDLKKCAKAVGVKSVSMLPQKELFPLTGYVRGGCTAIGMKKRFVTRLDETALLFDQIYVSAGRIGCQLCLRPDDFIRAAGAEYADLTE